MPAFQVALAERLEAYNILPEARRRYLKVVYTFGPNHYVPRSLYRAGRISAALGTVSAARRDWEQVVAQFPPSGPCELDSAVLASARKASPVEPQPYEHWVSAARTALAEVPGPPSAAPAGVRDRRVNELFPVAVEEGDPPKNGKREFSLGLHLLQVGDLGFATRDLLKVVTLTYPSRYMADAEYLLGVCALQRGLPHMARAQWERVLRNHAGTPAALSAAERLHNLPVTAGPETPPKAPHMPGWTEAYSTHAERGMTYGMRLFEHGLPLFAFKEMIKLLAGVYGRHELGAEARYRAGVSAAAFGNEKAAARQWALCRAHYPESELAAKSAQALTDLPADALAQAGELEPLAPAPKGLSAVRLRLAEEFRLARVLEGDQITLEFLKVLTVARPKPGEGAKIVATAMLGLADSLARTNRTDAALAQWTALREQFPGTPWAKRATEYLRQTSGRPQTGAADPDRE